MELAGRELELKLKETCLGFGIMGFAVRGIKRKDGKESEFTHSSVILKLIIRIS